MKKFGVFYFSIKENSLNSISMFRKNICDNFSMVVKPKIILENHQKALRTNQRCLSVVQTSILKEGKT